MLNALNIKKIVYGSFVVFVCVYFLSAFFSPIDSETLVKYNASELQLRLLTAAILLPVVGIWACAAYGFVHFKQYALSVKGSPYGKGTNTIANGLGIIVLQLLATGSLSVITSVEAIEQALGGEKGATIIATFLEVGFAALASVVIYQAAGQLVGSLPKRTDVRISTNSFYVLIAVSLTYILSIFTRYSAEPSADSIFAYIPLWAALVFVGLPYVFVWNLALLAVKKLYYYRNHAKGKVYKQAFGLLTNGLFVIIGSTVLIQLLGAFGDTFSNLNLPSLLLVFYVLIFFIGMGYLFVARAANKLRDVEH